MKAFEFGITGYEIKRDGNTLFIWELDHQDDRLNMRPLEITSTDLTIIMEESERLQAYNNPTCSEVSAARTRLENARAGGVDEDVFNTALEDYTDVLIKHREASLCRVHH